MKHAPYLSCNMQIDQHHAHAVIRAPFEVITCKKHANDMQYASNQHDMHMRLYMQHMVILINMQ